MDDLKTPYFSIIIPTRNRVALFEEALQSVVRQDFSDREIIVVNDGSTGADLDAYKVLESRYPEVNFYYLVHRPNGHGQSYSMNFGASQAKGKYVCFLDDDDYWQDSGHLSRAYSSLSALETEADAYFTNQSAYFSSGEINPQNPWIADLEGLLEGEVHDSQGSCQVTLQQLLKSRGFAHLNCSIYRRDFYHEIKGMDENIRYECDRDIFIRAIDQARLMLYNPAVIGYHRIPDPKTGANMSTMVNDLQKRLYQLNVFEKGILFAQNKEISQFCRRRKGYQLKAIAEGLNASGKKRLAAHYAWEALAVLPTFKWFGFTLLISVQALFSST